MRQEQGIKSIPGNEEINQQNYIKETLKYPTSLISLGDDINDYYPKDPYLTFIILIELGTKKDIVICKRVSDTLRQPLYFILRGRLANSKPSQYKVIMQISYDLQQGGQVRIRIQYTRNMQYEITINMLYLLGCLVTELHSSAYPPRRTSSRSELSRLVHSKPRLPSCQPPTAYLPWASLQPKPHKNKAYSEQQEKQQYNANNDQPLSEYNFATFDQYKRYKPEQDQVVLIRQQAYYCNSYIVKIIQELMQAKQKLLMEDYRFDLKDKQAWRNQLEDYGFCVFKNVISLEKCQHYLDQAWSYIQRLSNGKIDRKDQSTQVLGKNYPINLHGGMIQYIGHSTMQWNLRKECKKVFQALWKTKQLSTSFDGWCFMNGLRNYKNRQQISFLHVDQSPQKKNFWCYQGFINLVDCYDQSGGFVCIPQSHKYFVDYFQKKKLNHKQDWYKVPQQDKIEGPLSKSLKVNAMAGDFLVWDSRVFHCNTVPTNKDIRVCSYICMIPKDQVPKGIRNKRLKAFQQRRTSTHHPGSHFKLFPKTPRYALDRDILTQIVKAIQNQINPQDKQIKELL